MSAALARLRVLCGDELFVRGSGGLQPTPWALDLAEPLGRALKEIQRTLGFAQKFDPHSTTIGFNIGLSEHPAHKILPKIVDFLLGSAPAATLHVRTFTARDDAVTLLDSGEIDLAIGVPPRSVPGRILTRPLFEDPFVCVVRKDHPVARAPLDLQTFVSLPHLLVSPENDRFGHVDTALAERGLTRRLVLTLPQMYAAPPLIARSDLIATLMEGVVHGSSCADDLCIFEPPLPLDPMPHVMSWHRRNDGHLAQRWLRNGVAALLAPTSQAAAAD
jgi:DNA-binding transcriptional LysR family regulator